MILSTQIKEVLAHIENIEIPDNTLSPQEQGRAFYEQFISLAGKKEEVYQIQEQTITTENNQIPIRIYRPNHEEQLPVIIYFHGGWFNAGSLNTHDTPLRQLANVTQTLIIAIDYALAPEHPFPKGVNDCELATRWIIDHASSLGINANKIFIAGNSAGGALATTITRKLRHKISAQILIYPVTDNKMTTSSWVTYQNGPILNLKGAIEAWQWYLPDTSDHTNIDAIPLLADDLEDLPPTFIAIAEHDPLKDEAYAYADKLKQFNTPVYTHYYEDTIHGFFQMGAFINAFKDLLKNISTFTNSIQ
ncbi:alpha/beta hydrolase [Myroides marinus]|uniref:alpha/beta hydrolase n=1 Tax=Myroides marinus TaxID=703342 RepID=UPI0025757E94|nr:alpha/beta hydrolase [Myroides marinus]MDM1377542.1 alpha/beta hydrolase [Myroides marinus]MDM1384778.1 alpha/beta hydrolase [Myroides marinus]MDM1388830.1 alpha/beta hydrolase [Myroides marinus]MDM1392026.1 alpha/beta hydrolase [Myroides marinus]